MPRGVVPDDGEIHLLCLCGTGGSFALGIDPGPVLRDCTGAFFVRTLTWTGIRMPERAGSPSQAARNRVPDRSRWSICAGDEAEARRHADALLDITRAAGDGAVFEVAREVLTWTHPQEAVEIAERYAARSHRKRGWARLVRDVASFEARR
jgi:hypothetical protein